MGNQPSADGGTSSAQPRTHPAIRNLLRQTGALGLSKTELDERCKPSGLYPSCHWEDRAVRKLIGDGKLAGRLLGTEDRTAEQDQECPICFLHYSQVNVTKCCNAHVCTECYLQVRPQKEKATACPFCNHSKLTVSAAKKMDASAIAERDKEEQQVIEAKLRDRSNSVAAAAEEQCPGSPTPSSFGSSLAQNERVAIMRARSESIASEPESTDISSLAMTADERRALEEEMGAQHSHPVAMRLEAEEAERRLNNDREYYRAQTGRLRELRARRELLQQTLGGGTAGAASASRRRNRGADGTASHSTSRPGRDWNRIVDAFENSGQGSVQSLDDLVVLEAAIMLSMEEEANRGGEPGSAATSGGEEDQAGAATGESNFDAERHAGAGFPLARARVARQSSGNNNEEGNDLNHQVQSLVRGLRRRTRGSSSRSGGGGSRVVAPDSTLDTAAMLMRGITEEEQIAMAIAASLEESPPSESASETTSASADVAASGEVSEVDSSSSSVTPTVEDGVSVSDAAARPETDSPVGGTVEVPAPAVDTEAASVEAPVPVSESEPPLAGAAAADTLVQPLETEAPPMETVEAPVKPLWSRYPVSEPVESETPLADAGAAAADALVQPLETEAPSPETVETPVKPLWSQDPVAGPVESETPLANAAAESVDALAQPLETGAPPSTETVETPVKPLWSQDPVSVPVDSAVEYTANGLVANVPETPPVVSTTEEVLVGSKSTDDVTEPLPWNDDDDVTNETAKAAASMALIVPVTDELESAPVVVEES